jgi:hypothetical protein
MSPRDAPTIPDLHSEDLPAFQSNGLRFYCASKMPSAGEARDPYAIRDSSNRLLGGVRPLDPVEPHQQPLSLRPVLPQNESHVSCVRQLRVDGGLKPRLLE